MVSSRNPRRCNGPNHLYIIYAYNYPSVMDRLYIRLRMHVWSCHCLRIPVHAQIIYSVRTIRRVVNLRQRAYSHYILATRMGSARNMAMSFGNIGEYHEGREEWKQYAEHLDHFLAVNGITNADRQRVSFLSVIGPKAHKLLAILVAPRKPWEVSYADLVKITTDHQCLPPSEIVQHFKFHTRV